MKKILTTTLLAALVQLTAQSEQPNKPTPAPDQPCKTIIISCSNGTSHIALVCDDFDLKTWKKLLCGDISD